MAEAEIHPMRVCRKCGVEKPRETHFSRDRRGDRFRYRGTCKLCRQADANQRRQTDEHRAAQKRRNQAYYADNKARILEQNKAWRDAHPEWEQGRADRRRESMSDYRKRKWASLTPNEIAARYARIAAWKAANPEKAKAIDVRRLERIRSTPELKAKATAKSMAWRQRNPEAAAAARDRRRAREVGAEGFYTKDDVRSLLKTQGRTCFYCRCFLTKFECDHFIPLARGGSNFPENLRLACPSCNYSKGAKMPWEWRPDLFSPP